MTPEFNAAEKRYAWIYFFGKVTGDIIWWYMLYTMLLTFTIKKVSEDKLSMLTLNAIPNAFKFISGPFVDTYYIKKMGARKS